MGGIKEHVLWTLGQSQSGWWVRGGEGGVDGAGGCGGLKMETSVLEQ